MAGADGPARQALQQFRRWCELAARQRSPAGNRTRRVRKRRRRVASRRFLQPLPLSQRRRRQYLDTSATSRAREQSSPRRRCTARPSCSVTRSLLRLLPPSRSCSPGGFPERRRRSNWRLATCSGHRRERPGGNDVFPAPLPSRLRARALGGLAGSARVVGSPIARRTPAEVGSRISSHMPNRLRTVRAPNCRQSILEQPGSRS